MAFIWDSYPLTDLESMPRCGNPAVIWISSRNLKLLSRGLRGLVWAVMHVAAAVMKGALIVLALFGGLWAVAELASKAGLKRLQNTQETERLGPIQGAILGLLALLLGFSFSSASERLSSRIRLISDEANAIGTVWQRIDLYPSPLQEPARAVLRRYTSERIALYNAPNTEEEAAISARSESLQGEIWQLASRTAKATPPLAGVLLPPIDTLCALHAQRIGALKRHIPGLVLALLLLCSFVSVGAVSYGCGSPGRRNHVLMNALVFLVAAVLWTIMDLDHPRHGLVRAGQEPMLSLQKQLDARPAAPPVPGTSSPP